MMSDPVDPSRDPADIRIEDLRIDTWWYGPGKGGGIRITHLPTGLSVQEEDIPNEEDLLKTRRTPQHERLMYALREAVKKRYESGR